MKIGERFARTARRTREAAGLRPLQRALVAAHAAGGVGLEPQRGDQARAAAAHAVGPARVLLQPVHARPRLAHDDLLAAPGLERVARLALLAGLRQDQVHDVVGAAVEQPAAQILVDDVVRRRHDIREMDAVGGVVEGVERPYLHALWYLPGHPGRVARIPARCGGRRRGRERQNGGLYSPEWPVARSCASSRRAPSWMRPSRCRARSGARVATDAHSSISSSPTRAGASARACGTACRCSSSASRSATPCACSAASASTPARSSSRCATSSASSRATRPSSSRARAATSRISTATSTSWSARSTTTACAACARRCSGEPGYRERFRTAPATENGHHAYAGGLAEHTVAVAALCRETAQLHPRLNADLLTAAALLHDCGCVDAFVTGAVILPSERGRAARPRAPRPRPHRARGRRARTDESALQPLLGIVAAHHGAPEGRRFPSPEAVALHAANALDARVNDAL